MLKSMKTVLVAKRLGLLDGTIDATLRNDRGAREAFIRRLELGEAEWLVYRDAYNSAVERRPLNRSHRDGGRAPGGRQTGV